MTILLNAQKLNLEMVKAISNGAKIEIEERALKKIEESRLFVEKLAKGKDPIYGINTGFGFLANKKIGIEKLEKLQENLVKSHASGYGAALTIPETRLAMVLRLNVLVQGYSGVRVLLCETLRDLINKEIYPIIPEYGSVGASGDLAPLAHLALALIGEGDVCYKGKIIPARKALSAAKIKPIQLAAKEGLCLINGTQIMLAVGGLALVEAKKLLDWSDKITALTFEGFKGSLDALDPLIHAIRGHTGQMESARNILSELEGSKQKSKRVQDPYSLRCAPQIHGASRDTVRYACNVIETELNSVTDNPLVFVSEQKILSGGNFHGQYLAMAFDIAAIAISELANVSERRLEQLLNPYLSGLPAFLAPDEGVNCGYMAAQYLSASLVNENKLLANPSCTDSIPGNVGIEDHVSMGMTSARKLKQIVHNTQVVLTIEMVAAAQAIDLRKIKHLGKGTKKTYKALRSKVPPLKNDRIISEDIQKAIQLITGG